MNTFPNRYQRQTMLPDIGNAGQARLRGASVLVVGAGGLGAPVLQYLAGAGIGHLTVVDPDRVAVENLHRQTIFAESDAGRPKVEAAAAYCRRLNSDVSVTARDEALTPLHAKAWVPEADVVLDCADSFAVSYMLSDAGRDAGTPLISASVAGRSGYVGGYCGGVPSLRAVFPDLPETLASCAATGVMGPVVGLIGSLQAQMALHLLLGMTPSPLGQLVQVDAATFRSSTFRFDGSPEPETVWPFIARSEIRETDLVIELRGEAEAPVPVTPNALRSLPDVLDPEQRVVLCCAAGIRAWHAAKRLAEKGPREMVLLAAGASSVGCVYE